MGMIYLLTSCRGRGLMAQLKGNRVSRRRSAQPQCQPDGRKKIMRQSVVFFAALGIASGVTLGVTATNAADKPIVGLITKTNTNPFFVKMKAGAEEAATANGIELRSFAGKVDGDNDSQVAAIENLIASGAKGILITANDSRAIVPAIAKARAAGLLVIALDTPLDPATAADATFATDNFRAGELIGQWALKTLGPKAASAKIAMLDLSVNQVSVDVGRDQGFLKGFGIDLGNPAKIGDEKDARIVGHDITLGNEDGGRPGVHNVKDGVIGATSMQFPLLMAAKGVEAVKKFAETGTKPQTSPGHDFFNTGVELVTDKPAAGMTSIDSAAALKKCWG